MTRDRFVERLRQDRTAAKSVTHMINSGQLHRPQRPAGTVLLRGSQPCHRRDSGSRTLL